MSGLKVLDFLASGFRGGRHYLEGIASQQCGKVSCWLSSSLQSVTLAGCPDGPPVNLIL